MGQSFGAMATTDPQLGCLTPLHAFLWFGIGILMAMSDNGDPQNGDFQHMVIDQWIWGYSGTLFSAKAHWCWPFGVEIQTGADDIHPISRVRHGPRKAAQCGRRKTTVMNCSEFMDQSCELVCMFQQQQLPMAMFLLHLPRQFQHICAIYNYMVFTWLINTLQFLAINRTLIPWFFLLSQNVHLKNWTFLGPVSQAADVSVS